MIYLIISQINKIKNKILVSVLISMIIATTDEVHQIYSQSRGPKITDVGIDTLGAITGIICAWILVKIVQKIVSKFKKRGNNYDKFQENNK